MRIALLLVLAACGRFEFTSAERDSGIDVLLSGHDEDGDQLDDAIDYCPHVPATDNIDSDGDGVGDVCDPNPTLGGESFVGFWTLAPGDHPFTFIDGWVQEADGLAYAQQVGALYIDVAVVNMRIEIGFHIRGLVGLPTEQHQVASGVERTGVFYFVELNENDTVRTAGVVSYDATNGYQYLDTRTHPGIHAGTGVLRYDAMAATKRFAMLAGWWPSELYMASAATPDFTGGGPIRFTFNGVDLALHYVALIGSP